MVRLSPARIAVVSAAAVLPLGVFAALPSASAAPAPPALRLVAASKHVVLYNSTDDAHVQLDLGTHVIAGNKPFEFRVTRASYHDPILARPVLSKKPLKLGKPLPTSLVNGWNGFARFLHVVITDSHGKKVYDKNQDFCPGGGETARTRPDAVDRTTYPWGCGDNPFTKGTVWGIEAGWSASTFSWFDYRGGNEGPELPAGSYTAKVSVNKPFLAPFGIPANQSSATVSLEVQTQDWSDGPAPTPSEVTPPPLPTPTEVTPPPLPTPTEVTPPPLPTPTEVTPGLVRAMKAGQPLRPNRARPVGKASTPTGPRPDLQALPAWGIRVSKPGAYPGASSPAADEHEYLEFSANVWNAGTSPLVVDGFRTPGAEEMDAYQYFYDANGKQIGYQPTGKMQYDPRTGHQHWHFKDFARYRLLNAGKKLVVTSQKEAFCLAATDGIDLSLASSVWRPTNRDLGSACGGPTAMAIREYLDIGWGDTYQQSLPGQSFDVENVPNGTYYIEVTANPLKRLFESNTQNNTSLRKVVLGGTKGARTVTVPPYESIKAP